MPPTKEKKAKKGDLKVKESSSSSKKLDHRHSESSSSSKKPRDEDKRDREHKDRDKDRDKDRERRDRDKDREPKDRDKAKEQKSRDKDKDKDRERRHRDKEGGDKDKHKSSLPKDGVDEEDEERRQRREERKRRKEEENGERKHRKHKDEGEDGDRKHSVKKDEDEDRKQRKHRSEETEEERKKRKEEERARRKEKESLEKAAEEARKKKETEEAEKKMKKAGAAAKMKKDAEEAVTKKDEAEDEYNYDDDDFEDYDDDFEDDDDDDDNETEMKEKESEKPASRRPFSSSEKEVDEVMRAMNDENERLQREVNSRNQPRVQEPKDEPKDVPKQSGGGGKTFINFVSAKQRNISNKAASKARQRGTQLRQLLELDYSQFSMLDLPPLNEYELYMRSFGRSDTAQSSMQTGDDAMDRGLQTDPIECTVKWSQHPPDDFSHSCGGGGDGEQEQKEEAPIDSMRLSAFLVRAGHAINSVLEEEEEEDMLHRTTERTSTVSKHSNIVVSDNFRELQAIPMLEGRHVVYSHFSPTQNHMFIVAYSHSTQTHPLSNTGILALWNVNNPNVPEHVLLCASQPRCCCFSPNKITLAFAGMSDGSVCVWDLREPSSMHRQLVEGGFEWPLRFPTYNTAGVLHYENHQSPVIEILPVVSQNTDTRYSSEESQNFQIASLEENAVVNLWVVAELPTGDQGGSDSDLGLSPGGRVKLVKSSAISLLEQSKKEIMAGGLGPRGSALHMALRPDNNSHIFVATDTGRVIHRVRYGGRAPPRAFSPPEPAPIVTSVDFSPFQQPVFLTGCADGSVHLYHADVERPLISWPPLASASSGSAAAAVTCVRWCRSRPSVFFVLDADSKLHIWDLNMSDAVPMKSETIAQSRVTSFSLSNDFRSTGQGLSGRKPIMLVCLENGAAEVHVVSPQFSALMAEELDQFESFVCQLA